MYCVVFLVGAAMSAKIGIASDSQPLLIGDKERQSGLYILGLPRMGKSWLMVNMILQDIANGHGVFFLDPHGQAIEDIRDRYSYLKGLGLSVPYLLFDPEDPLASFGINPLHCIDVENIAERAHSFTRTKGVFDKLWKNTFEEKPWLQLVLQNTIYAFIENQGFTIAEFPLFFSDPSFRAYIVNNIRYNQQVKDYWLKDFASQSKHDQDEEMKAARTRLAIMLGHDFVLHILSQSETVLDFKEMIDDKRIILLKLSAFMSHESKKIIGTIVVNELLHAIKRRATTEQFCIFVDEFQNFASIDDFSILINQAPKFGIATTIAHHERFGQLDTDRGIIGATSSITNKILFQITARDAEEFAPEFAETPPTEKRLEEQYVISQNPVADLLRGHNDLEIRRFVTKYLRFLENKRDDIKADMEGAKFARMIELDTAAIYGAEAQEEGIAGPSHYASQLEAVSARQNALLTARMHSIKAAALHKKSNRLRVTMRELNRFLTEVMEGEKRAGEEAFSDFLNSLAAGYSALPEAFVETLSLYIKLSYGDSNTPRMIPFELGQKIALFSGETTLLANEAAGKTADKRRACEKEYKDYWWDRFYSRRKSARLRREEMKYVVAKAMAYRLDGGSNPYSFLSRWREGGGCRWGAARVVAEREGYGNNIACVYYENYYSGGWYEIDHFSPQMRPSKQMRG